MKNMRIFIAAFTVITLFATSCFCYVPKDHFVNPEDNRGYKLMYQSQTWKDAQDTCIGIGGKLAVPKSREQFKFLQGIVSRMHYPSIVGTKFKLLVWLGINNLDNYQIWKNVDGENIDDTGFHVWAGHNGHSISDDPEEPHCVGMDAMNFGLRDWWCKNRQPYLCEMQSDQNTTKTP